MVTNGLDEIKIIYPGKFPENYINDVNGWAFSRDFISNNLGKLLTLDLDFGIKCSLNCPHCFRKNNLIDKKFKDSQLTLEEAEKIVTDAKQLGLKSVKFLGKGEPFENENFLELIQFIHQNNIIPLVFTKGHVIGNDEMVSNLYSKKYGIQTGRELVKFLKKMNVSILLGFNSFDKDIQNHMVGDGHVKTPNKSYWDLRNRALRLLVEEGFNQGNPTRLCLATNPITNENYHEIFDIYKWGRERNMYVIVTPSMISGRAKRKSFWKDINPTDKELIDLYTNIYIYNIEKNIQTYKQVLFERISAYAGGHPCNQVSVGMYVTINGTVVRCPGAETPVFGNIRRQSLKEIWKRSENYGRCGQFNCGCPPKWGKTIPYNLFTEVLLNIKKYFGEI